MYDSSVRSGRVVGALYLLGTAAGALSLPLLAPLSPHPSLAAQTLSTETSVTLGALCVVTMAIALALIPAVAFPTVRRVSETAACSYLVLRGVCETWFYLIMATFWLSRSASLTDGAGGAASFFPSHDDVLNPILTIVFCLGATAFYRALWQGHLVPRWLTLWGFLGIPLYFISGPLILLGHAASFSQTQVLLNLPLAAQEMALAVYLLLFGFRAPPLKRFR